MLTFTTDGSPGRFVRETTPNPRPSRCASITRSSSCRTAAIARAGSIRASPSFGIEFYDYASPITEAIEKRWIVRHRLEKKDPAAAVSEPGEADRLLRRQRRAGTDPQRARRRRVVVEPGVRGRRVPERFQVRVLPADADPMDVRYNMINWVHRSTRGWSYGGSVTDPRTGEIIKGNVTLGSLRVRQDYMLGTG